MGRSWKNFKVQGRRNLDCFEEIVGRNMDVEGDSGKGSEVKSTGEKAIILENRCIIMNRIPVKI